MRTVIEKKPMKIYLFMPQSPFRWTMSVMIEANLFRRPILCPDYEILARAYDKDFPSLIVTSYYRGTNKKMHDKMLRLTGIHKANLIIVRDPDEEEDLNWYIRMIKAFMFFDDLDRPLCSVVTVGITADDYLGIPHTHGCENGECIIKEKLIGHYENIEYGFIYGYQFKKNGIISYARMYKSEKRNHVQLEPDMKIRKGNRLPFDSISKEEINIYARVSHEIWQL